MSKANGGDNNDKTKKLGAFPFSSYSKNNNQPSNNDDQSDEFNLDINSNMDLEEEQDDFEIDINSDMGSKEDINEDEIDIDADSIYDPGDDLFIPNDLESIPEEEEKEEEHSTDNENDMLGQIEFSNDNLKNTIGKIEYSNRHLDDDLQGKIAFSPLDNSPLLDDLLSDAEPSIKVITSLRAKKEKISKLNVHVFGTNLRNLLAQGSTKELYVPSLAALMREFNDLRPDDKQSPISLEQLQDALNLLQNFNRNFGRNAALKKIHPALSKYLKKMANYQFYKNEIDLFNLYATSPEKSLMKSTNYFGMGKEVRNQFIAILKNAIAFHGTTVSQDGDKFVMMRQTQDGKQIKLLEGNVSGEHLILNIPADTPKSYRYDAIAKLIFVVATHTQQNNSNVFTPHLGDDGLENATMLYLAFYKYRLRIALTTEQRDTVIAQISQNNKLPENKKEDLIENINFIFNNCNMFAAKPGRKGEKIIENRPSNLDNNKIDLHFANQLKNMHTILKPASSPSAGINSPNEEEGSEQPTQSKHKKRH